MLEDVVEGMSLAAESKGLSVHTHIGAAPLLVRGDEGRLRQVFWNLLSNSVKFTPRGGSVTVSASTESHQIVVKVADTGIGIKPAFLPYVFDKFRQEDGSHTRQHFGLGVGLAIARQFTEVHGGSIEAHSEGRDRGAVLTVRLPAMTPPA